MQKVVFVTPNWRWDTYPLPVDTLIVPPAPPLEWAYTGAVMSDTYLVELIDCYAGDLSRESFCAQLAEINPDYTVVSTAPSLLFWRCPPMSILAAEVAVSSAKRACSTKTIIVGPHGIHSPKWTKHSTGADFVFEGVPEFGLKKFISSEIIGADCGSCEPSKSLAKHLPIADFSIFDWQLAYHPHMWSVTDAEMYGLFSGKVPKSAVLEASRGCPWTCAYCAKQPFRDLFSQRNLNHLQAEMRQLAELGVQYVFFADETFNHNLRRIAPVLEMLRDGGLKFGFQGRADLLTDEFASELASNGCVYAELGIDTASDTLSHIISRNQKIGKCEEGVALASKYIPITRFNRINLSTVGYRQFVGGDIDHDWSKPADPTYPYPGSSLGNWWQEQNCDQEFDWDKGREYSWWLRLEVYLQRCRPELSRTDIEDLQAAFLSETSLAKRTCAEIIDGIVQDDDFSLENKFSGGEVANVGDYHSSQR